MMDTGRATVVAAALLAAAALGACSGNRSAETSGGQKTQTQQESTQEAAEAVSTAAAAVPDEERRELTDDELSQLSQFLNSEGAAGFLRSTYSDPEGIDLGLALDGGAGLATTQVSDEEESALLQALGQTGIDGPVQKISASDLRTFVRERTGLSLEGAADQLADWTYLKKYDAYYAVDTSAQKLSCTCISGEVEGGVTTLRYRRSGESGFHQPVWELRLSGSGQKARFLSNQFDPADALLPRRSTRVDLGSAGEYTLAVYAPDPQREGQDVTFSLLKDGGFVRNLEGVTQDNLRGDLIFDYVQSVDFLDINHDGETDMAAVVIYKDRSRDNARTEEARVFLGGGSGLLTYNSALSGRVNSAVQNRTSVEVVDYLLGRSDGKTRTWTSWQNAFAAYLLEQDAADWKGFSLIQVSEDGTPSLVGVSARKGNGTTLIGYSSGGQLTCRRFAREGVSYQSRDNLLRNSSGILGQFYDDIYNISDGSYVAEMTGTYGSDTVTVRKDEDGIPVYSYNWQGSDVGLRGYQEGLNFVFDTSRQIPADYELKDAGSLVKEFNPEAASAAQTAQAAQGASTAATAASTAAQN